jgi:tripartite-type tricarboxylate transporter receptor subunit TctC
MAEALAQAWPTKPVTLVVPFPPGGSSDQVARALGQKLNAALGQTFVIDNKAGATGTIGAAAVKRAAPDGYTWFVTSLGPLVIVPHLMKIFPMIRSKTWTRSRLRCRRRTSSSCPPRRRTRPLAT